MGANTAELIDTGEKCDERGRRIVAARHQTQLLAEYAQSWLTQRTFAEREGIDIPPVFRLAVAAAAGWCAGEVRPALSGSASGAGRAAPCSALEVVLPNGLVVRGATAAAVAELVRALQETP